MALDPQTSEVSYGVCLRQRATDLPEVVAVRHVAPDGTRSALTWRELDERSSQVAEALAERGLGFGDRLGIALPNSLPFVVVSFAAWKLGAVPVPIRWDLPEWEFGRLRDVVDARVHVGEEDLEWIDATVSARIESLPDVVSPHRYGICSSGSTGMPKVILSNMPAVLHLETAGVPMMSLWRPVTTPQRVLVLAPMYHVNGFSTMFSMLGGDELVLLQKFDAARVVDLIEEFRIMTFTATPTMLRRIADVADVDDRDLTSIDWILQGAAPMPASLVERWIDLIGADRILMAYGMTEGLGLTALRADEWLERRGSVGRPLRGTEIRIRDTDGRNLPPGAIGDVYLRTPSHGGATYLGGERLEFTEDGFATVGDMGHLDEDGFLYLADRRADLIISGGANVFPAEVEAALADHPAVADVVVIGLADPEWGRRVHAIVEPRDHGAPPAVGDLIAFAKARLAAYKVPKTVELVEQIPRSAATKVNRGALVAERGG